MDTRPKPEIREAASGALLAGMRSRQEIDGWRVRLYFWSRNQRLLALISLFILGLSGVAGLHFEKRSPRWKMEEAEDGPSPAAALESELQKNAPDLDRIVIFLEQNAHFSGRQSKLRVLEQLAASHLPQEEKDVFAAFWNSLMTYSREANADLIFLAHQVKPARLANELVGDFHMARAKPEKAQRYYERELLSHDSEVLRKKEVQVLLIQKKYAALLALNDNPKFANAFTPEKRLALGVGLRRWKMVCQSLVGLEARTFELIPVLLTLAAGLLWLAISLQAIQPPKWICFQTVLPFFALLAGMASTWPTLFAVIWEEQAWNLQLTGALGNDFSFFVLGVGVREELIKLLFFLPFVPLLLWRGRRLEMLVVAGCVGLGFAVEENLQYFYEHGAAVAFGRFLTANFFHLAATGLIGLSFCEALRHPVKKGWLFPVTAAAVILIHGIYDAFMAIPMLRPVCLTSMVAFLLMSQFYFRKLGTLRDSATDQLSIGATLVCGMALLSGFIFVCASAEMGFEMALGSLAFSAFSLMMIAYLFHWQLGEGISHMAAAKA